MDTNVAFANGTHVLQIDGSVGPSSGNVEHDGDVCVAGDIRDAFEVSATGNVTVAGTIGAARVRCGKDLLTTGGIAGKGKGLFVVGGNVRAKHISNATVEASGNIVADSMVWESIVCCGGNLTVENGPVAAGTVTVAGCVVCRSLGLRSQAPTVLEIGINEFLRRIAARSMPQIQTLRKKLAQLHEETSAAEQYNKVLTPKDRERAMERLFEADEKQAELNRQMDLIRAAAKTFSATESPGITVGEMVHPGVTVRIPHHQAVTACSFRGPLRIQLGQVGDVPQIVLLDTEAGSFTPLQSHRWDDPVMGPLERLLAAS
jgi:uncharacterized protein (DUF342 family)